MSINRPAPTPMHGAALRWLTERFNIGACDTHEQMAAAQELAEIATKFGQEQADPAIRRAYEWAATNFIEACQGRLEQFENGRAVAVAYKAIPKPGEKP